MAVIYLYRKRGSVMSTASWWDVAPDLFVGLVTHPRSRFPDAATPDGLLNTSVRELSATGLNVVTGISGEDLYRPDVLAIDRAEVIASIDGELDCELRWREYLAGSPADARLKAFMAIRKAKRVLDYAPAWKRSLGPDDPGPRMVRRLVNIELSHLRIIDEAVTSGARWVLLLEDDAASPDPSAFCFELRGFLEAADERGQPLMMNVSESFSPEILGIDRLLTPIPESESGVSWTVSSAKRPVTNTVCAVLYRGDFLARMRAVLQTIPLSPVIPIDFKLNEAVMRLAGEMRPGDCWVASPAPILQRSGVPDVKFTP